MNTMENGTLYDLCQAFDGTWHANSNYGLIPCPVCQPEGRRDQRGMSVTYGIKNGNVLLNCFKCNCDFREVIKALRRLRLWPLRKLSAYELNQLRSLADEVERRKRELAGSIWEKSFPLVDTLGETYFRGRGIDCELPESLRFLPSCRHGPSACNYPAVIARVVGPHGAAIHRTYLDPLTGRKANVDPAKMMLGSTQGGGVVLASGKNSILGIAEGIENGLSLASGHLKDYFGPMHIVAALSAANVGGLALPEAPPGAQLVIAGDGDQAGLTANQKLAIHAERLGWTVHHSPSPLGKDWNQVLIDD